MKEAMYMDTTNSEIRTQLLDYLNVEPDEEGMFQIHHSDVDKRPNYFHFRCVCDQGIVVEVTCHSVKEQTTDVWYGSVVIRHGPNSTVCLPKSRLNIGNTILTLMALDVIDRTNRKLAKFDGIKLRILANDILSPTINVRQVGTRCDLSTVTIKSLIEADTVDQLVFSDRDKLTRSQIDHIFHWAKAQYGNYDITNAEVALYLWNDWCLDKIKKSRLIPNEVE